MMARKTLGVLLLGILALLSATPLWANRQNTAVGRWTFTYWNDDSPTMQSTGSRVICFLPDGTWYSTTNSMRGHWFQKGISAAGNGDRVRMRGNWGILGQPNGNITMEMDFVNEVLMAGTLTIWRDPSLDPHPTPWMRAQAQRTDESCPPESQ